MSASRSIRTAAGAMAIAAAIAAPWVGCAPGDAGNGAPADGGGAVDAAGAARDGATDGGADDAAFDAGPPVDAGPEPAGVVANVTKLSRLTAIDYDVVLCMRAAGSRLLVASEAEPEGIGPGPAWVAAFGTNGSLDTTFAAPNGKEDLGYPVMSACAVDAAGRLVASLSEKTQHIKRWSADGGADTAFSRDLSLASVVVVAPGGGYVVASWPQADGITVTWLADDGSISASTSVPLAGKTDVPVSGILLPSGALLLSVNGVLAAIGKTGLDPSFGTGGRVDVPGQGLLALAPDGDILLVHSQVHWYPQRATPGVLVERFSTTGARISGVYVGSLKDALVFPGSILVQSNGKLLVAARRPSTTIVFRLLADASLDPTFGAGGILNLPFQTQRSAMLAPITDTSFAVAVDDDPGIGLAIVH